MPLVVAVSWWRLVAAVSATEAVAGTAGPRRVDRSERLGRIQYGFVGPASSTTS